MKSILAMLLLLSGCAHFPPNRSASYSLGSAAAGAAGGYAFSPNAESRALNTLFWGAIGGALGFLFERIYLPQNTNKDETSTLESRELFSRQTKDYALPGSAQKLPDYVKRRLSPVVIEEYRERDTIGDDGGLHEPHRVWRIKQQPELTPLPQK